MRTRREDAISVATQKIELERGTVPIVLFCAIYVVWTLFGSKDAALNDWGTDVVAVLTALFATVWSVWGIRRRKATGRGGWAASFLTLSIAAFGVGQAIWAYHELVLHDQPFPSWADAGYLLAALTMMAGVLLLPGRPMPALVRVRVLLDSLMVMAATITLAWFFILGPTLLTAEGTVLSKLLGAAYPCFDLAMLFCALILSARSTEREIVRVRNILCASVLAFIVADVAFAYLQLQGIYKTGNPSDAGWLLANLLAAQGALALRKLAAAPAGAAQFENDVQRSASLGRALLPYALIPVVGGVLIHTWKTQVGGDLALGVYVGSALLVVLVMVRQVFALAENSRLTRSLQAAYRELEAHATTDGMTGLPNHRVFQERLRKEIAAAKASGEPLTLLLIDVDRFKQYNDRFGHPAGDEALCLVARLLEAGVRKDDLPARYGGEEFAAILPRTDLDAALRVAERIRAAAEAQAFAHRAVTLSIGVSTYAGGEPGAMIEEADRALYAAKHGGRNRVVAGVRAASPSLATLPEGWSLHQTREAGFDRLAESVNANGAADALIRAMLAMLNLRDQEVERHSDRVMRYSLRLAQECPCIDVAGMADLHLGALLHDIGKVGVPDAILHKPGALNDAEWAIIRRHPIAGADLLADIPALAGAIPVVRSHHERWDGTGYPDGLAAEAIPLGARLFALADTMDAMWSDRPYRAALDYPTIRDEIRRMAGIQFDPALVKAFLSVPRHEWEALRAGEEFLRVAA